MQGSTPEWPGRVGGSLREVVHVHIVPCLRVSEEKQSSKLFQGQKIEKYFKIGKLRLEIYFSPVCKVYDWTCELPVSSESVHLFSVLDRISWIQPVCVLKLNCFPDNTLSSRVLFNGLVNAQKGYSVSGDIWWLSQYSSNCQLDQTK